MLNPTEADPEYQNGGSESDISYPQWPGTRTFSQDLWDHLVQKQGHFGKKMKAIVYKSTQQSQAETNDQLYKINHITLKCLQKETI